MLRRLASAEFRYRLQSARSSRLIRARERLNLADEDVSTFIALGLNRWADPPA